MKYSNVIKGKFISRPNRFIANAQIENEIHTVHVKNTGRCKELLVPNCTVYLSLSDNPHRKTKYDLIAVEKKRENKSPLIINMDSQIVNYAAEEWLKESGFFGKNANIRREVTFGKSRFDFFIESETEKAFLEVKGVTLEKDGIALFPDAPTERGVKHINELIEAKKSGYSTYILFVIQMKEITEFTPNTETHMEFAKSLKKAEKQGVKIMAMDCDIAPDEIKISKEVKIHL